MSAFKPGDRVVKVSVNPASLRNKRPEFPIGTTATVIADPVHPLNAQLGCDFALLADGELQLSNGFSYCWHRIDGNSGLSASETIRELTKPRVLT